MIDTGRLVFCTLLLIALAGCVEHRPYKDSKQHQATPLDASYPLAGRATPVQLVNGRSQVPVAGSAAVERTLVWGEPTMADLTQDGRDDAVLILVQDPGGSGTFYYLAVAIRDGNRFLGVDAVSLGDRIDPQRIDVAGNRVTVHYLDRERGQAMAVPQRLHELDEMLTDASVEDQFDNMPV